jgi:hypothetical protein
MGWWQKLFGPRERPEETLRLTRRAMDLLAEGKSDDEVQRALFREGVPVERAASLVAEVRRVQRMVRGPGIALLVGLGTFAIGRATPCVAQERADSVRPPAADSARPAPADTARKASADSSVRPASDTTSSSRPAPPPAVVEVMPVDTTLTAACGGVGPGGVAANLLIVVFRPDAPKQELAAVVKAVRGTLVGTVPSGDGSAFYLRVPVEGDEHRLGAAADEVIRYQPVQQVGPAVCPRAPPPASASRPDTAPPATNRSRPDSTPQPAP